MDLEEYYWDADDSLFDYCVIPTIVQTLTFAIEIIATNLVFLLVTRTFTTREYQWHFISTVTGLGYIYVYQFYNNAEAIFIFVLVYVAYFCFKLCHVLKINSKLFVGVAFPPILIACEFLHHDHAAWLKVRSIAMIAAMKIISIASDTYKDSENLPSLLAYSGYIWCPANSILGPWITYRDYLSAHRRKEKINFKWASLLVFFTGFGVVLVCNCNCFNTYIISDDHNQLLVSYRDALSFRMSHYFISCLARVTMLSAGYSLKVSTITHPMEIELPRSLLSVVTNWNIPTHVFLKKYVFQDLLPYGQFFAVIMTYVVSSMLHGLSIEISVVLLSLGLFSFFQCKLHNQLARSLNACVAVRPCKNCSHKHKPKSLLVRTINVLNSFSTIMYLIYVGCLMDNANYSRGSSEILAMIMDRWANLMFVGHVLLVGSVLFVWLNPKPHTS